MIPRRLPPFRVRGFLSNGSQVLQLIFPEEDDCDAAEALPASQCGKQVYCYFITCVIMAPLLFGWTDI